MRSVFILSLLLGVAYSYALHDNFASVSINLKVHTKNPKVFNDPPDVINGEFTTPIDHFMPTDKRDLLLVCTS